jgi:hypothetical protein
MVPEVVVPGEGAVRGGSQGRPQDGVAEDGATRGVHPHPPR